jgi:hypothetical protein
MRRRGRGVACLTPEALGVFERRHLRADFGCDVDGRIAEALREDNKNGLILLSDGRGSLLWAVKKDGRAAGRGVAHLGPRKDDERIGRGRGIGAHGHMDGAGGGVLPGGYHELRRGRANHKRGITADRNNIAVERIGKANPVDRQDGPRPTHSWADARDRDSRGRDRPEQLLKPACDARQGADDESDDA